MSQTDERQDGPTYCFHAGEFVPPAQATISVQSLAMRYALSVFEGIRVYETHQGTGVRPFKLAEHCARLRFSIDAMEMESDAPETLPGIVDRLLELNNVRTDSYVRVAVSATANGTIGIPDRRTTTTVIISPMGRKRWLAAKECMKVAISRSRRPDEDVLSPRIKNISHYAGSRIAMLRAKRAGFDMILHLNSRGLVSEAPTAAVMFVRDGTLITPPLTEGILESITRETLLWLARRMGTAVKEAPVSPGDAYRADEAFICGTGIEIAPIGSIDGRRIGTGEMGPLTTRLVSSYFELVRGVGGAS